MSWKLTNIHTYPLKVDEIGRCLTLLFPSGQVTALHRGHLRDLRGFLVGTAPAKGLLHIVDLHHVQLQEIYRCVIPVIHLHVPVHMHMNMWYICISIEHLSILDLFLPFSHDPAVASGSGEAHRTGAFTWDLKGSIILHLSTKGIVDVHILSYISIYNSEYKYWVFRNGVELNRHKCFLVSILYKILRLRCVVYAIFTKKIVSTRGIKPSASYLKKTFKSYAGHDAFPAAVLVVISAAHQHQAHDMLEWYDNIYWKNCRFALRTSLEIPFSEPDPFALAWSFEGAITHVWNTVCIYIYIRGYCYFLVCLCVRGFGGVYALYLPSVGIGVFSMTCELKKDSSNCLIDSSTLKLTLHLYPISVKKCSYSMTSTTNATSKISRI